MTYVLAVVLGLAAGVLAGMFGVGGGILFVPTLVALGLDQHDAIGTSLLAIIPTALVGTWRQARYGNVRWQAAAVLVSPLSSRHRLASSSRRRFPDATLRRLFAGPAGARCGADRLAGACAGILTRRSRLGGSV